MESEEGKIWRELLSDSDSNLFLLKNNKITATMRLYKNIIGKAAVVCMGAMALASCTDSNDWSVEGAYNRLFGPSESNIAVKPDATGAEVTFAGVKDAENYIIQVSNDSLFNDGVLTFGEDTKITNSPVYIDDLESDTIYIPAHEICERG